MTVIGPITLVMRSIKLLVGIRWDRVEVTHEVTEGEALVERYDVVKSLDLLRTERDLECLEVLVHMFNFSTADDREDVWCFLHQIRNGN